MIESRKFDVTRLQMPDSANRKELIRKLDYSGSGDAWFIPETFLSENYVRSIVSQAAKRLDIGVRVTRKFNDRNEKGVMVIRYE
jgi:hypothetical protein